MHMLRVTSSRTHRGLSATGALRSTGVDVPVIMLTARGHVTDRVVGLKIGADDYLTKPFEMIELLARIEALLRRQSISIPNQPGGVAEFGDVIVNLDEGAVTRDGARVDLSAQEYRLLCYFIQHRSTLLPRERLLKDVWGYREDTITRTVDVHVASLRAKLERDTRRPRHLRTVRGAGYRFEF